MPGTGTSRPNSCTTDSDSDADADADASSSSDDDDPPQPHRTAFRLSFQLTIGTGVDPEQLPGGEGFSLSYGDLPNGTLGELGGGSGLRIAVLTRRRRLAITYNGTALLSAALPPANLSRLRSNTSISVELRHRAKGLTFTLDGHTLLHDRTVPGWRPTPHWRFGVGARNHHAFDAHFVRDVRMERGTLLDPAIVPLEVSANGQQFSLPGPPSYTYYGAPHLSAVSPALGPAHGGTAAGSRRPPLPCLGTPHLPAGCLQGPRPLLPNPKASPEQLGSLTVASAARLRPHQS